MQTPDLRDPITYAGRHRIVERPAPSVAGYTVVGPLAQGGSGTVWAATRGSGGSGGSGGMVAIKVVPAVDAEDALVELAVLGRVTDPHLVRLHEAIALPSGEVALVLDHVAGGTVGSLVHARGHLATGEVVTVLSPIASTLARLHEVGVVHGDVSPDNVLLDLDGRPFLADLGVARIAGELTAEIRGTEGFVAPEVVLGAAPTGASDVHALGALAWFCLTGRAPDLAAVRGRLADAAPGLPDALVVAVEGALRIRPEDRPGADELALALFDSAPAQPLELAEGGDDVSLLTRRIRAAARADLPGAAAGGASRWSVLGRMPHVGRSVWAVLGGVLVVAVVAVVVGAAGIAGVAGSGGWAGSAEGAGPSGAAGASSLSSASASVSEVSPNAAADPRLAADAPVRDPLGLVQALATARARAWASGIAARLVEVDAPGSPALARDTEVLAGVQRAQQRYVGLTFVVREATVVGQGEGVVTVRARIDTGAHVVRGPSGEQPRPATSAAAVLLDLVHTDSGWRVSDVRPV